MTPPDESKKTGRRRLNIAADYFTEPVFNTGAVYGIDPDVKEPLSPRRKKSPRNTRADR